MRSVTVAAILLVSLAMAFSADLQLGGKRCIENSHSCNSNSDCCSECCNQGRCSTPDRCAALNSGACSTHYCSADKECYLQVVQCITAPCPPLPACRPKSYSNDYENYD